MIIVGAGGHARELLDVLLDNQYYDPICFFDNYCNINSILDQYKVLNTKEEVIKSGFKKFCIGVGKPSLRAELYKLFLEYGLTPSDIISSKAFISKTVQISEGVNIMPFASITNSAKVGKGSIIHYYTSIHHDVTVGEFCEISPGVRLLGASGVGDMTSIGTNAVILPKVKVGSNCKIGAGAVVTKDVKDGTTVKGIPAKS